MKDESCSNNEWGPWVDHHCQNYAPVPAGTWIRIDHIVYGILDGKVTSNGEWDEVLRYRIKKPRGLTILEELLQTLPKDVKVGGLVE